MLNAIITILSQFLFVALMLWCMAVGFGFVFTWKLALGIWGGAVKLVKFTIRKNN
jgi:hypothetical protein